MKLLQVDPDPATLLEHYRVSAPTHLRANFVSTLDGRATGADGRSGSINSPADKAVFTTLRLLADAVVVGAGTIRDEGYGPLRTRKHLLDLRRAETHLNSDHPALVVVTASGDIPPALLEAGPPGVQNTGHGGVLVICPESSDVDHVIEHLGPAAVLRAGSHSVDPIEAVRALHERGYRHLLTEGGPSLFGTWTGAGVVDELCLTVRPTLQGGPGGLRILEGHGEHLPLEATITQTLAIEGDLMLRIALR